MVTHVAVTGAAGRVGRGVLDLLCRQGPSVVAIDCVLPPEERYGDQVVWVQADMTDYDAIVKAFDGCDALVHLAAVPRPGKLEDHVVHNNNVVGSYNALRAAAEVGVKRICQASSINAIGAAWSRAPRYDYFPLDEAHSTYAEDPYSLSKWICEQQGDALARRYSSVGIASLRFHMVVPGREEALVSYGRAPEEVGVKNLWGYTSLAAAAGACWSAIDGELLGHEAFLVVAPEQVGGASSLELSETHYPGVAWRRKPTGDEGFFDCSKAARLLGWRHEDW